MIGELLKGTDKEYIAVEVSDTRIKRIEDRGLNVIKDDIEQMRLPSKQYDTVVGSEILEHLDNPGRGLAELCRVSKKRVLITVPIGDFQDSTHKWLIDYKFIPRGDGSRGELLIQLDKI